MLVEINLLPQKAEKNKTLIWLSILTVMILLIGGFVLYWFKEKNETKIEGLEQQIATTQQLIAVEQEKVDSSETSTSLKELESTVQWAKDYPIKTVPIIQKLTRALPEKGYLQTLTYEEVGTINLTVQFETSREAAYYLNSLQESDWVTSVNLLNLNAVTGFYDKQFKEDEIDNSKLKNEKYIPRYLAEFEIAIDREFLKSEQTDSSKESEEDLS